jgi:curved DNA-binding protein CbpA
MKDYYELLEVARDADDLSIKKAYFSLVRKYPPEQFPEEFKQIRAAYETLSNAQKRAEYDTSQSIPEPARVLLNKALMLLKQGYDKDAVNTLNKAINLYPKIPALRVELAHMYGYLDKTGNMVSTWEKLCAIEPDNTEYMLKLAYAYETRGWLKKAFELNERLLNLEPHNSKAWEQLLWFYYDQENDAATAAATLRALKAARDYGFESVTVLAFAFVRKIEEQDYNAAQATLQRIKHLLSDEKILADTNTSSILAVIMECIYAFRKLEMFSSLKEIVALFPDADEKTLILIDAAELYFEIKLLCEEGYHDLYYDLCLIKTEDSLDEDELCDLLSLECNILFNLEEHRKQIRRLQVEHPKLYGLHADFFQEAMICRDPEALFNKKAKQLSKKGYVPKLDGIDYDDGPVVQPVRREEPKIGRNDHCPCGSGKKYKRCCGA